MAKRTLLIPAMLDDHFPLLLPAFQSRRYDTVVLDNREGLAALGLRYAQNDLCYPGILIIGQVLSALNSGRWDPAAASLLIPQAGDACRGSNYLSMIRKALDRGGWSGVPVLSLNVAGLNRDRRLPVSPGMVRRALAGAVWGDALMLLRNQLVPFEETPGQTETLVRRWQKRLATGLERGRDLTPRAIGRVCREMAVEFSRLPRRQRPVRQVALVGELYIKYCSLGNWNLRAYLEGLGCEVLTGGLTWYALYYMESHLPEAPSPLSPLFRLARNLTEQVQDGMVAALREAGFHTPAPWRAFKETAASLTDFGCGMGDGWLIAAEIADHAAGGCRRILGVQPFGCLPGHVCGRGLYASLARRLPEARLVSVDFDASGTDVMVKSRVRMLVDDEAPFQARNREDR